VAFERQKTAETLVAAAFSGYIERCPLKRLGRRDAWRSGAANRFVSSRSTAIF
jgi:hypothetical protein